MIRIVLFVVALYATFAYTFPLAALAWFSFACACTLYDGI